MADHIKITPITGPIRVTVGDVVLGESRAALELREGSYPPVIYVPRDDMDMAKLQPTERATTCPWKGQASYFSIPVAGKVLENAVWSYETPLPGVEAIAGHLAFYTDKVSVTRG